MPMPPRSQFLRPIFLEEHQQQHHGQHGPTKAIPVPQRPSPSPQQQQQKSLYSFSAPGPTSFLEQICALQHLAASASGLVLKEDEYSNNNNNDETQRRQQLNAPLDRRFIRSQSESATLNKLADRLLQRQEQKPECFYSSSAPCSTGFLEQFYALAAASASRLNLKEAHKDDNNSEDQSNKNIKINAVIDDDNLISPQQLVETPCFDSKCRSPKHVSFADECGRRLFTVRVMTEPSDYPPKISPAVLRRIKRAAALAMSVGGCGEDNDGKCRKDVSFNGFEEADEENEDETDDYDEGYEGSAERNNGRRRCNWKLGFKQPASEYVKFRETLDRGKVALENVMLRNDLCRMIGTIKVANIAFEKHIFVRYTSDQWRTFQDQAAQYQCSPSKALDIFRFDFTIPRDDKPDARLEFCVCFKAGGTEYWDSNGGRNFALVPAEPLSPPSFLHSSMDRLGRTHSPVRSQQNKSNCSPLRADGKNGSSSRRPSSCSPTTTPSPSILPPLTPPRFSLASPNASSQPLDILREESKAAPTFVNNNNSYYRDDPYRMDWNSPTGWSSTNFASWRQLSTDAPYW